MIYDKQAEYINKLKKNIEQLQKSNNPEDLKLADRTQETLNEILNPIPDEILAIGFLPMETSKNKKHKSPKARLRPLKLRFYGAKNSFFMSTSLYEALGNHPQSVIFLCNAAEDKLIFQFRAQPKKEKENTVTTIRKGKTPAFGIDSIGTLLRTQWYKEELEKERSINIYIDPQKDIWQNPNPKDTNIYLAIEKPEKH